MGLPENSGHLQDAAPTIVVSNSTALENAIRTLAAGEGGTILLDGTVGPYTLKLDGVVADMGGVRLAPLDPDTPPVIASMELTKCAGIAVTGMSFRTIEADGRHDIRLMGCRDIEITGNSMQGIADGYLSETGTATRGDSLLLVRDSRNIVFSDNTVKDYFTAIGVLDTTGLRIENNSISGIQGDGIQGGGFQNAVISGNHLFDFHGSTQSINHSDMIQIWGRHTKQITRDVEISNNFLDSGNGAATQGIFILNEDFGRAGSPAEGYFENITITDNLVHNGMRNGISVAAVDGVVVSNNTVLWDADAYGQGSPSADMVTATPWILLRNVRDAVATANIVEKVATENTARDGITGNAEISYTSRSDPLFVHNHVMNWNGGGVLDARDFQLRADSDLAANGQGARVGLFGADDGQGMVAAFNARPQPGAPHRMELQAEVLDARGQPVDMAGMEVRWIFADGTWRDGATTSQTFATPGAQAVGLQVITPDGTMLEVARDVTVADPVLLHLDFDGPLRDLSAFDSALGLRDAAGVSAVEGLTGGGFLLGNGTAIDVARSESHLFGLDRFSIDLAINPRSLDGHGEILSQHSIFKLFVTKDGGIGAQLNTDAGRFTIDTGAGALQVGTWQQISLRYDDVDGRLGIGVNGDILAEVSASGTTAGSTPWGLTIGRTWSAVADAVIDDLVIARYALAPEPDAAQAMQVPAVPLVDFRFDGDLLDLSHFDTKATGRSAPDEMFGTRDGRIGLQLDAGRQVDISRDSDQLSRLDSFDIDLSLALDRPDEWGGLLTLHTIFDLDVLAGGALRFRLKTDEGSFAVQSAAGTLHDTAFRDLNVRYSDDEDRLAIYLDGDLVGETHASGTTAALTYWPLVVGEAWGKTAPAFIDHLAISVPGGGGDGFDLML